MTSTQRRAHLEAEFFRHNTLWTGAQVLRELGDTPQGGLFARLGAILFVYLAFEGSLNHLGEALFPVEWADERKLFSQPPLKGTLGKLSFIASRCGLQVSKGTRPYTTLKQLDKQRSALVHPRTERIRQTITFTHPRHIPPRLESELSEWTSDRSIARGFEDVAKMASDLVAAARAAHPKIMNRTYGAGLSGAIGTQGGHIE